MNSVLSQSERRLLVESAFCALNHGMVMQAESIMKVLPWLIEDNETRIRCQILLLVGLHRMAEAQALFQQLPTGSSVDLAALFSD